MRGLEIRIDILERGVGPSARRLGYNHLIDRLTMQDIVPLAYRPPGNALEAHDEYERQERRKRIVDMIAAKIAHALTDAMTKPQEDN